MGKKYSLLSGKLLYLAVLLGMASVVGALILGLFSYRYSVQIIEKEYRKFYLDKAKTLAKRVAISGNSSEDQILKDLIEVYLSKLDRPPDEYLCVVDPQGTLLLHTLHPDTVGNDAGSNRVLDVGPKGFCSLKDLPTITEAYVGGYISSAGQEQIAAFVHVPERSWTIGIHRSRKVLDSEIVAGLNPLFYGLLIVCGLMMPASLLLLYSIFRRSHRHQLQVEEAHEEARQRYRTLFEGMAQGAFYQRADGVLIDCNPAALELFGLSRDQFMGRTSIDPKWKVINQDGLDVPGHQHPSMKALTTGKPVNNEVYGVFNPRKNDYVWLNINAIPRFRPGERKPQQVFVTLHDITERRRIENELREREERNRQILQTAMDGFWRTDTQGRLLEVNQVYCHMSGYDVQELLAMRISDLETVESAEDTASHMRTIMEKGEDRFESQHRRKDGSLFDVEVSVQFMEGRGGGECVVFLRDITEEKRADAALRESQERLQLAMDSAKAGTWTWNVQTEEVFWDDRMQKIFGLIPGTFDGTYDGWRRLVHPDDIDSANEATLSALNHGKHYDCNYRISDGGGGWRVVNAQAEVIRDSEDRPVKMIGLCVDITDRTTAEQEIIKQRSFLEKAQEIGNIGTWELDIRRNVLLWTDENYRIFGLPIGSELDYEIFLECVHPDDREYVDTEWHAAMDGKPYDIEHRLLANGEVKWVREKAELFFDEDGKCISATGVTQDITEAKQAQSKLSASEERFKTLFDNAPLSYQSLDESGNFIEVNSTWLNIMGYSRNEVIGRNFSEFLHPKWQDHFKTNFPKFKAVGEVLGVEFEMQKKDGSLILVSFHGKIATNDSGGFKQTHCVFRDITNQRQAEEEKASLESQLRQSQKMEALGTLAGGIAHDFNNILASINGFSELALEDAETGVTDPANIMEILKASKRAKDLVTQILTFGRKLEPELKPVNLNELVNQTESMLERIIPKMISIEKRLTDDLWLVNADSGQLAQALMNLATNAKDAMPEGGRLVIETDNVTIDEGNKEHHTDISPGHYVLLTVSDTGYGMDKETQEHIFDPFFTLKEIGKGTGLGLATVYGAIKNHDGYIICNSEVDHGTTFNIYLPVSRSSQPSVSPGHKAKQPIVGGSETILLVDDEESLRVLGTRVLSRHGYQVLLGESGEEALEIYQAKGQEIALVILDVSMPGMGGHACLKQLIQMDQKVKVIIASGYSLNGEAIDFVKAGAVAFISKPFPKLDLLQLVRQTIDQ